jgi:hypothetical protein
MFFRERAEILYPFSRIGSGFPSQAGLRGCAEKFKAAGSVVDLS